MEHVKSKMLICNLFSVYILENYFQIGLNSMFHKGLTKIVNGKELFVTKAVQAALIEVCERGTVAAAASGKILFYIFDFITSYFQMKKK